MSVFIDLAIISLLALVALQILPLSARVFRFLAWVVLAGLAIFSAWAAFHVVGPEGSFLVAAFWVFVIQVARYTHI